MKSVFGFTQALIKAIPVHDLAVISLYVYLFSVCVVPFIRRQLATHDTERPSREATRSQLYLEQAKLRRKPRHILIYIYKAEKPSVCLSICLSTFHSGCSANSRTTLCIEVVFAPHEALITYLCQEYQQTLLTAVVCRLQHREYERVDKNQLEIFVKTTL